MKLISLAHNNPATLPPATTTSKPIEFCFFVNYLIQKFFIRLVFDYIMGNIKQVIVVRTDLDMGKGKIAAQVGHACVLGAEHVRKSHPEWYDEWWNWTRKSCP